MEVCAALYLLKRESQNINKNLTTHSLSIPPPESCIIGDNLQLHNKTQQGGDAFETIKTKALRETGGGV